jgi:hypothetical protein
MCRAAIRSAAPGAMRGTKTKASLGLRQRVELLLGAAGRHVDGSRTAESRPLTALLGIKGKRLTYSQRLNSGEGAV